MSEVKATRQKVNRLLRQVRKLQDQGKWTEAERLLDNKCDRIRDGAVAS